VAVELLLPAVAQDPKGVLPYLISASTGENSSWMRACSTWQHSLAQRVALLAAGKQQSHVTNACRQMHQPRGVKLHLLVLLA